MSKTLVPSRYNKLVSDVRSLLEEGRTHAQVAVSRILLETYYRIGNPGTGY